MRILFLFSMAILLIAGMICLVGCSRDPLVNNLIEAPIDDHRVVKEDAYIHGLELSISESRPAQVMVTATVSHRNICILDIEIYQERKENTISLWATKTIQRLRTDGEVMECGQAEMSLQKQVSIGEFTVGEYKVITDDLELVFHIEEDESWVITKPPIGSIGGGPE